MKKLKQLLQIGLGLGLVLLLLDACQIGAKQRMEFPSKEGEKMASLSESQPELQKIKQDPENLYLEEIRGVQALEWVDRHNKASLPTFESDPRFLPIKNRVKEIMDDPQKLITVTLSGDWAYNFWRDAKNIRGLWRRMPIAEYLAGKRQWEILLDIDELATKEKKNWLFAGAQRFKNRALISLSDGGKDSAITREFDLPSKSFVTDGFNLPEGKNHINWINEDEVFLGLALDPQEVTTSGYPRQVRIWKRNQAYRDSRIIFSGAKKDVSVSISVTRDEEDGPAKQKILWRSIDFFHSEKFLLDLNDHPLKLDLPQDAGLHVDADQLYVELKSAWKYKGKNYKSGSLLSFDFNAFLKGNAKVSLIFEPTKTQFMEEYHIHRGRVFLILLDDVSSKVFEAIKSDPTRWTLKKLSLPENSSINTVSYSKRHNLLLFTSDSFLQAKIVHCLDLTNDSIRPVDQAPRYFDANLYQVEQHFTRSKDGTRIPYYVVHKKNLPYNSMNPTIINAYGGFEVSLTPHYSAGIETAWLQHGGVWIVANIRGGGEYGPQWHTSVLKENRQRVFDDYFAVAEDVIRRKISSPRHLGAVGGSNGGLLMGVAMTQRPELYNAIAIQVPLLDMLRYHKLLAGASWIGEYGDPEDPQMRRVIEGYSPYQNIKAQTKYPEVFFMTSTADDRVHPGHARRTAAKMEELGHRFYYYENTEGGHGGSANNEQSAKWAALQFVYFLQKLN